MPHYKKGISHYFVVRIARVTNMSYCILSVDNSDFFNRLCLTLPKKIFLLQIALTNPSNN